MCISCDDLWGLVIKWMDEIDDGDNDNDKCNNNEQTWSQRQ
jgi:hypothetical protein